MADLRTEKKDRSRPPKILDQSVLIQADSLLAKKNRDGTVTILNFEDDPESCYNVDGVAAELWLLIDGKRTFSKIKSLLLSRYDVSSSRLDKDLAKLIGRFFSLRLLALKES